MKSYAKNRAFVSSSKGGSTCGFKLVQYQIVFRPVLRDTVRGGDPAARVRKTSWSQGKHGPTGRYERSLCGSRKHGDAGNALLLRAFFVLALSSLFFLA